MKLNNLKKSNCTFSLSIYSKVMLICGYMTVGKLLYDGWQTFRVQSKIDYMASKIKFTRNVDRYISSSPCIVNGLFSIFCNLDIRFRMS